MDMSPIPALKLSVSASGTVVVSRTPFEVHHDGDEESFCIPLGRGKIRVAESYGLGDAQAGTKYTHFIPMFGRHGTLEGLTVGSDRSRKHAAKTLLVILEGPTKLPSVSQAGHHVPLCGMTVKCEAVIHGFVIVLRRHEQLAFEVDHTCHRYVNRNGELVAGY